MKESEIYKLAESFLRLLKYIVQIVIEAIAVIPCLILLLVSFICRGFEILFHAASSSLAALVCRIMRFFTIK